MILIVEACTKWKWLKKLRMHQVDTYFWAVSAKGDLFYQKARGKTFIAVVETEKIIELMLYKAKAAASDPDIKEWQFAGGRKYVMEDVDYADSTTND
ncbi:MAG: hypothetical protein BBJ57_07400 [Desulfobacterales bacterium PC51MH44]|nr:MAG: hypothetical protein BBJ57_07400 [Desulfobacterales bacterium PC51MH44]